MEGHQVFKMLLCCSIPPKNDSTGKPSTVLSAGTVRKPVSIHHWLQDRSKEAPTNAKVSF